MKRHAPCTPSSVQSYVALWGAIGEHEQAGGVGAVDVGEDPRASMVLFFDFDIFSMSPISTGSPISTKPGAAGVPSTTTSTSLGAIQSLLCRR